MITIHQANAIFKNPIKHLPQLARFVVFLVHVVLNRIRRHDAMAKTNKDLQLDWWLQFTEFICLQLFNDFSRLCKQNVILLQSDVQDTRWELVSTAYT